MSFDAPYPGWSEQGQGGVGPAAAAEKVPDRESGPLWQGGLNLEVTGRPPTPPRRLLLPSCHHRPAYSRLTEGLISSLGSLLNLTCLRQNFSCWSLLNMLLRLYCRKYRRAIHSPSWNRDIVEWPYRVDGRRVCFVSFSNMRVVIVEQQYCSAAGLLPQPQISCGSMSDVCPVSGFGVTRFGQEARDEYSRDGALPRHGLRAGGAACQTCIVAHCTDLVGCSIQTSHRTVAPLHQLAPP